MNKSSLVQYAKRLEKRVEFEEFSFRGGVLNVHPFIMNSKNSRRIIEREYKKIQFMDLPYNERTLERMRRDYC